MPENDPFDLKAVLFDLDGTLLDTAPDLANALNITLTKNGLAPLAYDVIRPYVSYGAVGLLKLGFGNQLSNEQLTPLKKTLIDAYQADIATSSTLFQGMSLLLDYLDEISLPWGIVTNKPQYLTDAVVKQINLYQRAACVISGDQVAKSKPYPDSIYLACETINVAPINCVYLGDAERDIRAGNQAGCQTIACEYGYIPDSERIAEWNAHHYIQRVEQIKPLLTQFIAANRTN